MNRVTVTAHDAPMVADVIYVDPAGNADTTPLRTVALAAGVPTGVHLRPGNVLVVREPVGNQAQEAA